MRAFFNAVETVKGYPLAPQLATRLGSKTTFVGSEIAWRPMTRQTRLPGLGKISPHRDWPSIEAKAGPPYGAVLPPPPRQTCSHRPQTSRPTHPPRRKPARPPSPSTAYLSNRAL
jgi:hypothetical protein